MLILKLKPPIFVSIGCFTIIIICQQLTTESLYLRIPLFFLEYKKNEFWTITRITMYFAQNNSLDKFELYLSFLADIVKEDNQKYKVVFTGIFKEVKDLALGNIDYSQVSSETFDIVSILSFNQGDYFKDKDIEALGLKEYEEIYNFLENDLKHLA